MRMLAFTATLAWVGALGGLAQGETPQFPPAFPREGARLVMDNARGLAWDVVYTPGKPTPMHQHRFDFVGIELADSSVTTTTPEGVRKSFPTVHGEAYFLPRGTTHIEETPVGTPTRHAIILDLKDVAVGTSAAATPPMAGARKTAESARVILWDYALPTGQPPASPLARDAFIVVIDGGAARPAPLTSGEVIFRPAGSAWPAFAPNGGVKAVIVEVK